MFLKTQHYYTTQLIMCLIFTCGEHTFRKQVEGYEGVVCRCQHCGNYSAHVLKEHPWFTFCFIVSSQNTPPPPKHLLPWHSLPEYLIECH